MMPQITRFGFLRLYKLKILQLFQIIHLIQNLFTGIPI